MSIARTLSLPLSLPLSLRPAACLAATAAAVVAAGTSVVVAGTPLPTTAALRPLPVVAAQAAVSTPVTGPVGVGARVDAAPLVDATTRAAGRTAAAATELATGTAQAAVETATAEVDRVLRTTVPLALDTADAARDTAGAVTGTVTGTVDTAVELAGSPVSGTVTLCPGAVVHTGAHVRLGDLLVLRSVVPTATLTEAGGLVTDVEDGVQLGRQGASVSTPTVQPDRLATAAGADAVAATRLVPLRFGVGADWRTATGDGAATASTGAGPLSLATTAASCGPVDWALVR